MCSVPKGQNAKRHARDDKLDVLASGKVAVGRLLGNLASGRRECEVGLNRIVGGPGGSMNDDDLQEMLLPQREELSQFCDTFGEACSSKGRSHSLGQIRRVGPGGPENVKGDIAASRVAANELAQRPGAGKKDASFCAGARVQQGEAAARTKCLETWSLCDIFPVAR